MFDNPPMTTWTDAKLGGNYYFSIAKWFGNRAEY